LFKSLPICPDADHLVAMPTDDLLSFEAIEEEPLTIPCKPTHPSAEVRLDESDQVNR